MEKLGALASALNLIQCTRKKNALRTCYDWNLPGTYEAYEKPDINIKKYLSQFFFRYSDSSQGVFFMKLYRLALLVQFQLAYYKQYIDNERNQGIHTQSTVVGRKIFKVLLQN